MHVLMVCMMCGVHPSLVSWVFVECCSRETPDIQVGAGNISYHSQITKQTNLYVDMDICVGGTICEAVYLYVGTRVCLL